VDVMGGLQTLEGRAYLGKLENSFRTTTLRRNHLSNQQYQWFFILILSVNVACVAIGASIFNAGSLPWESMWMLACGVYLVLDVSILQTYPIIMTSYIIPSLARFQIRKSMVKIIPLICRLWTEHKERTDINKKQPLSAAADLYISRKIADTFPLVFEAHLVRAFNSPWPVPPQEKNLEEIEEELSRKKERELLNEGEGLKDHELDEDEDEEAEKDQAVSFWGAIREPLMRLGNLSYSQQRALLQISHPLVAIITSYLSYYNLQLVDPDKIVGTVVAGVILVLFIPLLLGLLMSWHIKLPTAKDLCPKRPKPKKIAPEPEPEPEPEVEPEPVLEAEPEEPKPALEEVEYIKSGKGKELLEPEVVPDPTPKSVKMPEELTEEMKFKQDNPDEHLEQYSSEDDDAFRERIRMRMLAAERRKKANKHFKKAVVKAKIIATLEEKKVEPELEVAEEKPKKKKNKKNKRSAFDDEDDDDEDGDDSDKRPHHEKGWAKGKFHKIVKFNSLTTRLRNAPKIFEDEREQAAHDAAVLEEEKREAEEEEARRANEAEEVERKRIQSEAKKAAKLERLRKKQEEEDFQARQRELEDEENARRQHEEELEREALEHELKRKERMKLFKSAGTKIKIGSLLGAAGKSATIRADAATAEAAADEAARLAHEKEEAEEAELKMKLVALNAKKEKDAADKALREAIQKNAEDAAKAAAEAKEKKAAAKAKAKLESPKKEHHSHKAGEHHSHKEGEHHSHKEGEHHSGKKHKHGSEKKKKHKKHSHHEAEEEEEEEKDAAVSKLRTGMPKASLTQGVGHAKVKPPKRSVKKAKHEDSSSEEEDSEEESVESPEKQSSKLKNRGRLVASQTKMKRGVRKVNAVKQMGGSAAPKKANSEYSVSDSSDDDDDDDASEMPAKKSALHSAGGAGRLGGRSALMGKLALVSGAKQPTKVSQESGSSSGSYSDSSSGSGSYSSGSSSGSYSDSSSDSDDRKKPVAQALRSRVGMRGGAAMLNAAHKVSGFASHM